jgi:hypothetical protein
MVQNSKKSTISINHHICPIFSIENNLSKLQFNFTHFIEPNLTLRGPASLLYSHIAGDGVVIAEGKCYYTTPLGANLFNPFYDKFK